jgi:PncC family amidohydrolase
MTMESDAMILPPNILDLSGQLGDLLRQRGLTFVTAESCTGGGIANAVTSIAGSSDYMLGGIVAYSNGVKQQQLGVSAETLSSVGAVSEHCAREMARGARERLGADISVSSTGIAGPGGATARKPVGLVYIAASSIEHEEAIELRLTGDRLSIMQDAIRAALQLTLQLVSAIAPDSEH